MPSGLPGVDTIEDYGGAMVNAAPVTSSTYDEDASYRNILAANVAGMTQTACRAWCTFVTAAASTPTDPASNVHGSVWGATTAVKPVVARTTFGTYTITWPSSIEDALAQTHVLSLRRCWVNIETSGFGSWLFMCNVTAPNVVTLYAYNRGTVALADSTSYTFTVYAI